MKIALHFLSTVSILFAVSYPQIAVAQQLTASGTWSTGARRGAWNASLTRDGDIVRGQMQLTGAPVSSADVAGTLRADQIELGIISNQREIASFDGSISLNNLSGELTMGDATGKWSGTWQAVPQPEAPITDSRPGTVQAPFDQPSAATSAAISADVCDLLTNGGVAMMSFGGEQVLRNMCAAKAGLTSSPSAPASTISCNPGPPESNPPTPSGVVGTLVNSVSRPLQTWPAITQSETSGAVSLVDVRTETVLYNDTQFRATIASHIGFGYRNTTTGWTQNSSQFVLPPAYAGFGIVADPSASPDTGDLSHVAHVSQQFQGCFGFPPVCVIDSRLGMSTSRTDAAPWSTYANAETAIQPAANTVRDKEWLAVDWTTNASKKDTQHLCWTNFTGNTSRIWFARRQPGHPAFDTPVAVSVSRTYPEEVQGCQVAVAPDNSAYVMWWEEVNLGGTMISSILGRRSADGVSFGTTFNATPDTFTKPSDATATADCGRPALKGHVRIAPLPSMIVNRQNGAVYVAFMRRRQGGGAGGESEIIFVRSTDQGAHWSGQLVVNDSPTGDKFMPAVAHSPHASGIKVIWYDRRNDPLDVSVDV